MDITTKLLEMGVSTWATDIITQLPVPATENFEIGKTLPENVGFIYGISIYADSLDPVGNTLISTTQAQGMYINIRDGATTFFPAMKLSDFLSEVAGSPIVRAEKFVPVNIKAFDLSTSSYSNPNLFTGAFIRLKLWYIQKGEWQRVKKHFTFDKK